MSDSNWPQGDNFWQSSFMEDAPSMHSSSDPTNILNLYQVPGGPTYTDLMQSHPQRAPQVPRIDTHFAETEYGSLSGSSGSPDSAFPNKTPSVFHQQYIPHVSPTQTVQEDVHAMSLSSYSVYPSSPSAAGLGVEGAKLNQGLTASYGLLHPVQIPVASASPTPSPIDVHSPAMLPPPSPQSSSSPVYDSYTFDYVQGSSHEQDIHRQVQRRHVEEWKSMQYNAVIVTGTPIFVPQKIYKPHTVADQRRYIEEAALMRCITFENQHPQESGVPLIDALRSSCKFLINKEESMFEGAGPSVSIRVEWPGYNSWTRQIPTKDFRTPKQPITREKLAKNIANCVKRFIEAVEKTPMEEDADPKWRVGGRKGIKLEDLMLVSLHHVSQGSWQPQLRLRRPL